MPKRQRKPTAQTKRPTELSDEIGRRTYITLTHAAAEAIARYRIPGESVSTAISRLIERLAAIEDTLTKISANP